MLWTVPRPLDVHRTVAADGAPIFVRRHGNPDGPRLVLSHGSGLSADAYFPFWSRFLLGFEVIVFDIRNHGWNPVGPRETHNFPTFVDDHDRVLRDIDRHFGEKPRVGMFHSLSSLVALFDAHERQRYDALVLYDLPIVPSGGLPPDLEGVGHRLAQSAATRREKFASLEEFADRLSGIGAFGRLCSGAPELLARTTLRRAADGGYELRCPREYDAQVCEYIYCWAIMPDLERLSFPIKVIAADPVEPYSFMPGTDLSTLIYFDYDFIPETTHLLQLEEPGTCAAMALDFLRSRLTGFGPVRQGGHDG